MLSKLLKIIRIIFEKFALKEYKIKGKCPHCEKRLKLSGEFTGYTNEIELSE